MRRGAVSQTIRVLESERDAEVEISTVESAPACAYGERSMTPEHPKKPNEDQTDKPTTERVELPQRGEATVEIGETPPPSPHTHIHRRRAAPPVPDKRPPKGD
jgi:hypothetical protein